MNPLNSVLCPTILTDPFIAGSIYSPWRARFIPLRASYFFPEAIEESVTTFDVFIGLPAIGDHQSCTSQILNGIERTCRHLKDSHATVHNV